MTQKMICVSEEISLQEVRRDYPHINLRGMAGGILVKPCSVIGKLQETFSNDRFRFKSDIRLMAIFVVVNVKSAA